MPKKKRKGFRKCMKKYKKSIQMQSINKFNKQKVGQYHRREETAKHRIIKIC